MKSSSRRDFLKTSAVAGGVLAVNHLANAYPDGNDNLVRVGLVGCGGRGSGAIEQNLLRAAPINIRCPDGQRAIARLGRRKIRQLLRHCWQGGQHQKGGKTGFHRGLVPS